TPRFRFYREHRNRHSVLGRGAPEFGTRYDDLAQLRLRHYVFVGVRFAELPHRARRIRYRARAETMILSHFTALLLFALFVSTVFALITKNEPREQFRYGVFVFLSFLAVAFAVGWIMYPLPL